MSNAQRLVDQLADLTAIRDLQLLEFSLLRTVNGFLQPQNLRLLKLDGRGRASLEITFNAGSCAVNYQDITLPEEVRRITSQLDAAGIRDYSVPHQGQLLTAYALHVTRSSRAYLLILSAQSLSKLDAHLMSGLLQVYRNFCDLLHDAQTDQLTGLANRKTFDDCIHRVYELLPPEYDETNEQRRRDEQPLYWLAMVDIDHFKSINDRFGHLYGDEVLLLLAQTMKGVFREDDMLFRFGGEEFVLILRNPDQATCAVALERFRQAVESRHFPQVGQVTISVGVTRMAREVFAITLLDYADQALYHSKQTGRNRVTFFEDMLAAGIAKIQDVQGGGITFL